MLNRDKLNAMLRKITAEEFAVIWKNTYGYLPEGSRADLARDYVAEQYDEEIDNCIAVAESLLSQGQDPKPKPKNKWLPPR